MIACELLIPALDAEDEDMRGRRDALEDDLVLTEEEMAERVLPSRRSLIRARGRDVDEETDEDIQRSGGFTPLRKEMALAESNDTTMLVAASTQRMTNET